MANAQDKITSLLDIQNIQREAALAIVELDKIKAAILSTPKALSEYKAAQGIQETRVATEGLVSTNNKLIESQKTLVQIKQQDIQASKAQVLAIGQESTVLEQNIATRERLKTTLKSYQTDQKEDLRLLREGQISQDEYRNRINLSQQKIESYKLKIQDLNKEIKNQTRESLSAQGALDGMRAKLNLLTSAYDRFSDKQKASIGGQRIKTEVITLTQEIKNQEQEVLKFQRNVGNYAEAGTNSFQKAYSGLRTLANILPGIGISGIVLLFSNAIANAANAIFDFGTKAKTSAEEMKLFNLQLEVAKNALKDIQEITERDTALNIEKLKQQGKTATDISELTIEGYKKEISAYDGVITARANSLNKYFDEAERKTGLKLKLFNDKLSGTISEGSIKNAITELEEFKLSKDYTKLKDTSKEFLDNFLESAKTIKELNHTKFSLIDKLDLELQKEITKELEHRKEIELEIFEFKTKREITLNQIAIDRAKNLSKLESSIAYDREAFANKAYELELANSKKEEELEKRKLELKRHTTLQNTDNKNLEAKVNEDFNAQELAIEAKFSKDRIELNQNYLSELIRIKTTARKVLNQASQEVDDQFAKANDPAKELSRELSIEEKIRQQRNTVQDQAYADSVERLNTRYAKGKMSEKKYNDERDKINYDYQTKQLEGEIHFTEQMLGIMKAFGVDVTKQQGDLAKLKAALSDAQRNHRKKELEDQKKDLQDLLNEFKEYYDKLSGIISSAVDLSITKKRNQIAEEMKLNDEAESQKIEQVKNSTLSEQEKANQIIQIQASAAAQRRKLEQEDKQAALKKAQFDKANALFHIAIDTAQAVIKDLNKPFKIAFDIALGAAQAAIVAATPLPKFERGTNDSPEGLAKVHTGEMVVEPSGRTYMTPPGETIAYLPRHSKVITRDEVNQGVWNSMIVRTAGQLDNNSDGKLDEIKQAVLRSGQMTASAIKRVRQTVIINNDAGFMAHINQQVKN